jgi:hypothetical protein
LNLSLAQEPTRLTSRAEPSGLTTTKSKHWLLDGKEFQKSKNSSI